MCRFQGNLSLHLLSFLNLEADLNIEHEELVVLEKKSFYVKYISLVETAIMEWVCENSTEERLSLKRRLWQQLIITSNVFATKSIEQKKYAKAMGKLLLVRLRWHVSQKQTHFLLHIRRTFG